MRAASTSSPSAISTMAASAPEVTSSSIGKVGHSACHGPALRSCSCTCAAKIVAARLGAMMAAASAAAAATGLRLCGMVEEPPRPSPEGSNASATSVCIISWMSRAILPQVPARIASTEAASAMRSRWVCQGASGNGSSSSCASLSATRNPLSPSAASVPAAPPNCSASASRAQSKQPPARTVQCGGIFRELEAERHRQRMLQPGAGDDGGVAMLPCEMGKTRDGAVDIPAQRIDRRAQGQHCRGIDDVLAGGAPVHIARGIGVGPGDIGGERLDEGDCEIAGAGRRVGEGGEIERRGPAGVLDRARRGRGDDPGSRLGARKRGFKIEHVLQIGHVVANRAHGGARQHRREQGRRGRCS